MALDKTRAGFLGVFTEQPRSIPHLEGFCAWADVLKFLIILK